MTAGSPAAPAMTTSASRLVFTSAEELGATPRPEASALTLVSTPAWEASAMMFTVLKRARMRAFLPIWTFTSLSMFTRAVAVPRATTPPEDTSERVLMLSRAPPTALTVRSP